MSGGEQGWQRDDTVIAFGLLAVGALVRIVGFAHNASVWGDEAMLALNIGARDFSGLARPLDYAQMAPVPFLWGVRALVLAGGVTEPMLRLLPFLAGVSLIVALAAAVYRLLPPLEAVVSLGLAATAFPLVRYTAEIKPYTLDALASLAVTWAAFRVVSGADSRSAWRRLLLVGLAAAVISLPAVFVLAGTVAALGLECASGRAAWRQLLPTAALWGLLWTGCYLLWYREGADSTYMRVFWSATFLVPGTPEWWTRLGWGAREAVCSLNCWRGLADLTPVYTALLALGAWGAARRWGLVGAVLLVSPLALSFAASMGGKYPLATRLLLFTAPQIIVLVAMGLVRAAGWVEARTGRVRARWLLSVFLLPSTVLTLAFAFDPPSDTGFSKEELRPLIAELLHRASPGDPVYVYHRASPAWVFYTTEWPAPDRARLAWAATVVGPEGPGFVNGPSRGPRTEPDRVLTRPLGRRLELLGSYSGSQGRQWQGYVPREPDTGWDDVEVARMKRAASPRIWLIFADYVHGAQDDRETLLAAVRRAGGTAHGEGKGAESAIYRVEF